MGTAGTSLRTLPSDTSALRVAREAVRGWLPSPLAEEFTADVVLCADELVGNALDHSRGPYSLELRRRHDRVLVAVHDRSARPVGVVKAHSQSNGDGLHRGRGLRLVNAVADRWGVEYRVWGKIVWCEFLVPDGPRFATG